VFKKKKINEPSIFLYFKNKLKKITFLTGIITLTFIGLIAVNMMTDSFAWMRDTWKITYPVKLKTLKVMSNQILGPQFFSLRPANFQDYFDKIIKPSQIKFDDLFLDLDYKSLSLLDEMRSTKDRGTYINGFIRVKSNTFLKAKKFKIKIRAKGDRTLHRKNISNMSYKVKIKGDDRLYGLREFSIQKPIIRNYTMEYLIQEFLKTRDLLTVKSKPVRLYVNNQDMGNYSIEEGFSKELLELNKRKDGPIAGLDETLGVIFPNVTFDFYSEKKWKRNNPDLLNDFFYKLERLKKNFTPSTNYNICTDFDCIKWARFYGYLDFFGAHHGLVLKSVKLYLNPSTGLIEPIFFDGHVLPYVYMNKNIILDSISNDFKESWHKDYILWFRVFFNLSNPVFLNEYLKTLDEVTTGEFAEEVYKLYIKKIDPINSVYYKSFEQSDGVFGKALLPFYFDFKNFFKSRVELVNKKASLIFHTKYNLNQMKTKKVENKTITSFEDFDFESSNDSILSVNDINIDDRVIKLEKPITLILTGNSSIKNVTFDGPVMIVQNSGTFVGENITIKNGSAHRIEGKNWSGVLNLINSKNFLKNVKIINANAEDGINLVGSDSRLDNIYLEKTFSDAIDVDFGSAIIGELTCIDIGNDCLDISETKVTAENILAKLVSDKVISLGERSNLFCKNVTIDTAEIGLVSKDNSSLIVENYNTNNVKLDVVAFTKKNMFDGPNDIEIKNNLNNKDILYLISNNSNLIINNQRISSELSSVEIENKLYGNEYGKATVKTR